MIPKSALDTITASPCSSPIAPHTILHRFYNRHAHDQHAHARLNRPANPNDADRAANPPDAESAG
jgi:murein endopeptidase